MPSVGRITLPAWLATLALALPPATASLRAASPPAEDPAPAPTPPPLPTFQAALAWILARPEVQAAWTSLVARKAECDAAGLDWHQPAPATPEAAEALARYLEAGELFVILGLARLQDLRQQWLAQGHPEPAGTSYMMHLRILVGANLCRRVDQLLVGPA